MTSISRIRTNLPSCARSCARRRASCAATRATISRIQNATFAILRRETSQKASEELARELQYRLQAIHEVAGNPVTITYGYSIVHSNDPAIYRLPDASVSYIYRLALERLRHKD